MQRLVFLVALTACYRPGSEVPCTVACGASGACPDGLTCDTQMNHCALPGGGCGAFDAPRDGIDDGPIDALTDALTDAVIDAVIDVPPIPTDSTVPGLCVPSAAFTSQPLGQGNWFTPDLDRTPQIAVKYLNGEVQVTEGNPNTLNQSDYSLVLQPVADVAYDNPRLAPTRDEVYYLREDIGAGLRSMRRETRLGPGTWSSAVITLKQEGGAITTPIVGNEDIGAPTTTNPRRMLISTAAYVDEYTENTAFEWIRVRRYFPPFGNVALLGRATLSEDGRRMVFKGQIQPANVAGFYIDRASISAQFGTVATQIPANTSDSVDTPYLSEDCRHFYYTFPTSGQIQHVMYP